MSQKRARLLRKLRGEEPEPVLNITSGSNRARRREFEKPERIPKVRKTKEEIRMIRKSERQNKLKGRL